MARVVERTIDIEADVATVWGILAASGEYPAWNPFITAIQGEIKQGERPEVHIKPPGAKEMAFRPTVIELVPEKTMRWLGKVGVRGLFDGEHSFTLSQRPGGGVHFVQRERFSGLLVPLFGGVIRKAERGFENMNEALKARAESRMK